MPLNSIETKTRNFTIKVTYPKKFDDQKLNPNFIAELIKEALDEGIYHAWWDSNKSEDEDWERDNMRRGIITGSMECEDVRP